MKKFAKGVATIPFLLFFFAANLVFSFTTPCAVAFLPRKVHKDHRRDPGGVSC